MDHENGSHLNLELNLDLIEYSGLGSWNRLNFKALSPALTLMGKSTNSYFIQP